MYRKNLTYYEAQYDQEFADLMGKSKDFEAEAIREELSARKFSDEASDKAASENLYGGLSLASWLSAGIFVTKSIVCFVKLRREESLVELEPKEKNYEITLIPSRDMSGALATIRWRW